MSILNANKSLLDFISDLLAGIGIGEDQQVKSKKLFIRKIYFIRLSKQSQQLCQQLVAARADVNVVNVKEIGRAHV